MVRKQTFTLKAGRYFIGNPASLIDDETFPTFYKDGDLVEPFDKMTDSYLASSLFDYYDELPWSTSEEGSWVLFYAHMMDTTSASLRLKTGDVLPLIVKDLPSSNVVGIVPADLLGNEAQWEAAGLFVTFPRPVTLQLTVENSGGPDEHVYNWAHVVTVNTNPRVMIDDTLLQLWFKKGDDILVPLCPSKLYGAERTDLEEGRDVISTVPLQELWNMWAGVQLYNDVFKVKLGKPYRLLARHLWDTYGDTKLIVDVLSFEVARRAAFQK
jgi:hypothetical protein